MPPQWRSPQIDVERWRTRPLPRDNAGRWPCNSPQQGPLTRTSRGSAKKSYNPPRQRPTRLRTLCWYPNHRKESRQPSAHRHYAAFWSWRRSSYRSILICALIQNTTTFHNESEFAYKEVFRKTRWRRAPARLGKGARSQNPGARRCWVRDALGRIAAVGVISDQ